MASTVIFSLPNLFFFISLTIVLNFQRVSSKVNLVKIDSRSESPIKHYNTYLKNSITIAHNKTSKRISTINNSFIFSNSSLVNVSVIPLNESLQRFAKHTGYISIRHSYGARLFYFFFESRGRKNDPIVLWLNGGPGAGSALSLFTDNGPFHINDDLSLKWNDFGCDKVCNLLYVDQPTGTGFSYSSDDRDIRTNSIEVSNDLYNFLQTFFQAHPDLIENDFYIAGTSYSGHTIPLLASQINEKNKAKEGNLISLKGFAIANGLTNPEYSFSSFPDFIYANNLILKSSYDMWKEVNKECLTLIKQCQSDDNICKNAHDQCIFVSGLMRRKMGYPNPFDFRLHRVRPPFFQCPRMSDFLALDQVRSVLGVGNRKYMATSKKVYKAMINDTMKNYASVIPSLLDNGIKVLIFDGEYDLLCNWLGNLRWMEAMKWNGRSQFLKTKLTSYKVDGKEVGKIKNIGPLTFLKVLNAGHSVPTDQPYVSLNIIKKWMNS